MPAFLEHPSHVNMRTCLTAAIVTDLILLFGEVKRLRKVEEVT